MNRFEGKTRKGGINKKPSCERPLNPAVEAAKAKLLNQEADNGRCEVK